MIYPKDVYHIREDVTQENKKEYNKIQDAIKVLCLQIDPDYYKRGFIDRLIIHAKAEKQVTGHSSIYDHMNKKFKTEKEKPNA